MKWVLTIALTIVPGQSLVADIDAWLTETVPGRMAAADIPAVVIGVVHGAQTRVVGFGVDAETAVVRVGSVSKPVTASVVLALVAEGVLDLHADLRPTLAPLPVRPPLGEPLTLHQLLTHTAGFNERLFGQHTRRPEDFQPLQDYLTDHLPPRFEEPGRVIAYNDHHTALAGWVAARAIGTTFAEAARAHVFLPLGMTDSTFEQVNLPPCVAERRLAAVRTGQGPPYAHDYLQLPPAAGLYTSASDMVRYLRALLEDQLPGVDMQLKVQHRQHPALAGRAYGFAEGRHGGNTVFYKDGQASGFNARLLVLPAEGFGFFVAHNRSIFGPFGRIEPAGRFNRMLGDDLLEYLFPVAETAAGGGSRAADRTGPSGALGDPHNGKLEQLAGTYRTVVAARHTWERIISITDEIAVEAGPDALSINGRTYRPGTDRLFRSTSDGFGPLSFSEGERPRYLFIGASAYERVPAWTGASALLPVVGLPLVLLLVAGAVLLRSDGWWVLPGNLALLLFFFGFVLIFYLTDLQRFFLGPPPVLLGLLTLPLFALAGLARHVWCLVSSLQEAGRVAIGSRIVSVLSSAVLLAWLAYWNLLGYRLG